MPLSRRKSQSELDDGDLIGSSSRNASVRGTLSEERVRALLEVDALSGSLPISCKGKISRTHYAVKLGYKSSSFTRFINVFSEFERKFKVVTGPVRYLPEMRAWLTGLYERGELGLRDGKVDRSAFAARFGLRGGSYMRLYPEIRALFQEFDARAERENYMPATRLAELERVRVTLAAGPELNKDRMTISLIALSAAAGVPRSRFRDKLFAEAIAEAQAKIRERAGASKIDPFFHGRIFAFSDLMPLWGALFLGRVAIRFKQVVSTLSQESSKDIYLSLFRALSWIGKSADQHCQAIVAEALKNGRVRSSGEWEDALFSYRAALVSRITEQAVTESSIDSEIKVLRVALDVLTSGRLIPVTATPLPGVKYARRRAGHRRSVAEVGLSKNNTVEDEIDYVTFARKHFDTACKAHGSDMGAGNVDLFFAGIAAELEALETLPKDPVKAVCLVLERRLEALRSRAVAVVQEAEQLYERGCELLSKAAIDCGQFEADYFKGSLNRRQRRALIRNLFPDPRSSSDEGIEQGTANFLAVIDQLRGGIPPRNAAEDNDVYGRFFGNRYFAYGGLRTIAPMLNPEGDAVGAALTLYLIESGANVSVGRTLDRDCIEASDLGGYHRITGHKARAKGKPIIIDLPDSSPAIRAIKWLLSAGRRLPVYAGEERNRLFLMRIGSRVQLMTSSFYAAWFKDFVSSAPGLEGLNLLPSMIRPSVLLHASLSNDGRLMTGMALGQQSTLISQGYQQKWPTRLLYDQNIRRFQGAFETLIMANVEDAASKLGITVEQFDARLGDLRPTGLGTYCQDQRGRPGELRDSCSSVDCWNDCPHLLIVAEVEAIAALQLWQTSLRAVQPEWERDQPERWDEVWLPWLCLTDVVEEKMVRGPMIKIWKAASKRAAEISAQIGYVPPRPW